VAAAAVFFFVVLIPGVALAQLPGITPKTSITPTRDTGGWVFWMAEGAIVIGAIILIGIVLSYLRFAPRFFGREQAPRAIPGQRPPTLARQAAAMRQAPSAPTTAAAGSSAAAARAATGTAVAQRPAAAPAAASVATAPPSGEPAVQDDAVGQAETEAPEGRPTAKTAEDIGAAPDEAGQATAEGAEVADPETPTQQAAPAAAAPAPAEPRTEPQTEAGASPRPAPQPASSHGRGDGMDQETFDRVLKEQLDKGVDKRVAEGRARAAAVVAARKKAQG